MLVICWGENLSTKNKIHLQLEYENNWIDHPLYCEVKVDNRLVHLDLSGQKNVSINKKIVLEGKNHTLSIRMYNKDNRNVSIKDNQIVQDSFIKIKNVFIDQINITSLAVLSSDLVTDDGTLMQKTGALHINGVWNFKFDTPVYEWLLQEMYG
jgi:hypothetical protein